ncbi:osteoclast-stimulating factor 1-like [Venturia canescens]|uniref:osteoclast-stimulating factor 1-like n=1 Tax=Venturia canescens TaxID=32260 RepID=UPI001C9CD319|nr:osteoclast-stimulating factor 1-like [Venturia canescens]
MAAKISPGGSEPTEDLLQHRQVQPPKPVSRPGKVKVVRALYKYTARNADELSFEEGQLLYVQEHETDPNWWRAKSRSNQGLVPANYVEEQTEEIEMPLHEAARRGNISYLKECLSEGVSSTGLDTAGNTALYWASRTGHIDCVRELLSQRNPPLDAQNKMGDTPLHVAANHGYLEVVELLLQAGADPTLWNNDRLLAEELASDYPIKNTIQMYRKHNNFANHGYNIDDYNDESD